MTAPSVHDRLVSSAVTLLRTHGADGFGMSTLLTHSSVARRSMYQHFPSGKAELLREATAAAGKGVCAYLKSVLAEHSAVDALELWADQWKTSMIESDYALGCPLAAASLSAQEYPDAAAEAARAFERATSLIGDALQREGLDAEQARLAGGFIVSGLEGAILVARATRSVEPFDTFVAQARAMWFRPQGRVSR
ncbi:TetR/AcrR family transcriptional regulator [Gordonia sp. HY002]|uniref:TetR/AcrR family transcriptional regulator n=1 Tax=Gordonia zhenghanii TaxID=2911516 RepID=UPI001EF0A62D|nr:TetR/AcrR family transcriptional regulator [Gordonia zhenghanii]MCF8571621.1 TetR/AcrR family transcriptional regulator [Gordonia zhenghanii]MCF8602218.1 TetR/AcrR family transcriptional regulator [Gordonia zhenghanii]